MNKNPLDNLKIAQSWCDANVYIVHVKLSSIFLSSPRFFSINVSVVV